jgi:SAM-dependent methyltransferase
MLLVTILSIFCISIILIISAIQHYKEYVATKKCLSHQETIEKLRVWYDGIKVFSTLGIDDIIIENKVDNTLYGEITYDGMQTLAKKLKLTSSDVFYDLGCGIGKLVVYMYLSNPIKKSVGIEMVGQRYKGANLALKLLKDEGLLHFNRSLLFIHNNIRNENFSDATVIFMSSLCFSTELMEELDQKFTKLKKGLRVVSLIPLPNNTRLSLKDVDYLPMSWTDTSRIYYYELT